MLQAPKQVSEGKKNNFLDIIAAGRWRRVALEHHKYKQKVHLCV